MFKLCERVKTWRIRDFDKNLPRNSRGPKSSGWPGNVPRVVALEPGPAHCHTFRLGSLNIQTLNPFS